MIHIWNIGGTKIDASWRDLGKVHLEKMPEYLKPRSREIAMPSAFNSYKPRHMKVYGAICVNDRGEVLLVRGRRSQKWSFPKGHCKSGETNLECARRELHEETGILVSQEYVSYHNLRGAAYYVFAIDGNPAIETNDHWEIQETSWWPLAALPVIDSNVDVSIFRTLMKSMKGEPEDALNFIESPEAKRRVANIQHNIDSSASASASAPSISLPINVPFSF